MSTPPKLRGIPLNTSQQTDATGFAPIYDPSAIRFGRKVNFVISILLTLGLGFLTVVFLYRLEAAVDSTSDSMTRMLFGFVLPIVLVGVGFIIVRLVTSKVGFDLTTVYSVTVQELRAWLPSAAGEFPEAKDNALDELKDNFSTVENVVRHALEADHNSFLYEAAIKIAQQSAENIELTSKDNHSSILKLNASGRYQLLIRRLG